MHFILLFSMVLFATAKSSSFINPYPEIKPFRDGGDPGEPLFLTKYIENGDIKTAQRLAFVNHSDISIESYSGYLTVNKKYNSNLFFWYFPAKVNAAEAPVLLWLQGGPGGSSLYGLFTENGPFSVSSTQKLIPREYSWHSNQNLIYIDNPVGTGFSFTESDDGFATNETQVGQELLIALQQFFVLFPKLQKNAFFVSGESYAGKYIPAIGYAIYQDSKRTTFDPLKPKINLKGLAIGNGLTDPIHQLNFGDYLYQLGLIDLNARNLFMETRNEGVECLKKGDFICGFRVFNKLLGEYFSSFSGYSNTYNYLKTVDDDTSSYGIFLQKSQTRRALHVGSKSYESTNVYQKLIYDFMDSVADWLGELLSHYPVLVFYGQLDIICAYPVAEEYLQNLNFTGADVYKKAERSIWRVDGEIAGYVKHAGNLEEVLVRNAGHMVPRDQPKWAYDMLSRFIRRSTGQ